MNTGAAGAVIVSILIAGAIVALIIWLREKFKS